MESWCFSVGGVKRPAEGSKEEPSEKKNLPILAKTFTSKKDSEKCLAFTDQTSSKVGRAAAQVSSFEGSNVKNYLKYYWFIFFVLQKVVLSNSHNKNGTLTSKCVECKSHVHLVQRHFVEGKLYHRSCFK